MGKAKAEIVIPPGQLWPLTPGGNRLRIDLIGVTGEQDAGKTCFLLGIAPGVHPEGHTFAGQPRTLYIGMERSATTYSGTGAKIIEVVDLLASKSMPPTPANLLNAVESLVAQVPAGKYDCLAIDPISDLDTAKTDQVVSHPEKFGMTKNMVERSGAGFKAEGIVWGRIKDAWKEWMLTAGQKFQCVVYSTHLRDEFRGKIATGKREPKGKDTIWQVTTLGLWLSREPSKSRFPTGVVFRKDRLADTRVDEKTGELEVIPLLPPRLEVCTPAQIRYYIANPPNYDKLKDGEKVAEEVVSEVEVQRVRLATAQAEAEAATARANLLDRQKELAALRSAPVAAQATPAQPQTTSEVCRTAASGRGTTASNPATPPPAAGPTQAEVDAMAAKAAAGMAASKAEEERLIATQSAADAPAADRVQRFKVLFPASGVAPEKLKSAMAAKGADRFTALGAADQDALLAVLQKAVDAKVTAGNGTAGGPPKN